MKTFERYLVVRDITLSTKYAEKDGVGGFAPNNKSHASPSGLDPGASNRACSKPPR